MVMVLTGATILLLLGVIVAIELLRQYRAKEKQAEIQWESFNQFVIDHGLDATQAGLLRRIHGALASQHPPDALFRIPAIYDRALDAWLGQHGGSLDASEWQSLARIRQTLRYHALPSETSLSHTRQIAEGQPVMIKLDGSDGRMKAVVLANTDANLVLLPEPAQVAVGEGAKLHLWFTRNGDGEYDFSVPLQEIATRDQGRVWVLGHTSHLHRRQLRSWVRVPVHLPARMRHVVSAEGEKSVLDALLVDLSGGGARARCRSPLPQGAGGVLEFSLGDHFIQGLRFRILRCVESAREASFSCHLCFEEIEASTQERIIRYVFEQQRKEQQLRP